MSAANPIYDALLRARRLPGSDVHVRSGQPISYRVNRRLRTEDGYEPTVADIQAFLSQQLGDRATEINDRGYIDAGVEFERQAGLEPIGRIRLNARRGSAGAALALSVRLHAHRIFEIDEFGIGDYVERLVAPHRGLDLLVAPMGQGKSALRNAVLQTMANRHGLTIASFEDPIEQWIRPGRGVVEQIEIGTDIDSYAATESPLKRTDLDVVSYAELRDRATKRAALNAARSMQCIVTMHAASASEAIEDYVEAFPPEEQSEIRIALAQGLHSIIVLRALPRPIEALRREDQETVTRELNGRQNIRLASEILHASDAVRNLIRKGDTYRIRMEQTGAGREFGSRTLEAHMAQLALAGEIDPQDPLVAREIRNRVEFEGFMRRSAQVRA